MIDENRWTTGWLAPAADLADDGPFNPDDGGAGGGWSERKLAARPAGPVFRHRLSPGEGIIGNNVLHNRTAFRDDPGARRPVCRLRFCDPVAP